MATDTTIDSSNHLVLIDVPRITNEMEITKENLLKVNDQEMLTMMTVVVISTIPGPLKKKDLTIAVVVARICMVEIIHFKVVIIVVVLKMEVIVTITLHLRDIHHNKITVITEITEKMIPTQVLNQVIHNSVITTTNKTKIIQLQTITIG